MDYKRNAEIFKAFCDENRLRILVALKEGEKCACTLLEEVQIAQSTLSHHMRILLKSSIVTSRREGKWTYYAISDKGAKEIEAILGKLLEKNKDYKACDVCTN